jgi:hypothetical protein
MFSLGRELVDMSCSTDESKNCSMTVGKWSALTINATSPGSTFASARVEPDTSLIYKDSHTNTSFEIQQLSSEQHTKITAAVQVDHTAIRTFFYRFGCPEAVLTIRHIFQPHPFE